MSEEGVGVLSAGDVVVARVRVTSLASGHHHARRPCSAPAAGDRSRRKLISRALMNTAISSAIIHTKQIAPFKCAR